MSIRWLTRMAWLGFAALFSMSSDAIASGVRIVDASGQRNFADIQSAIDAAVDGDVLLVGAGVYPGFTVDGKSLSIIGVPAGVQAVEVGNVVVRNLDGKSAVICGFSAAVLTVQHCSGYVAIQSSSFVGPVSSFQDPSHTIDTSRGVVLSDCAFVGGSGSTCIGCPEGVPGRVGMTVSSSAMAAYDCTFQGGKGGYTAHDTGNGGDGLIVTAASWCFAAGCSITGGDSGNGPGCLGGEGAWCGFAGDGLRVESASEFVELSNHYSGGHAGSNCCNPGDGAPIDCFATCDTLSGRSRSFTTPFLSVDRAPWSISIAGTPGDQVFLNRSVVPVFQYDAASLGVCTSQLPPFAQVAPLGVVPGSGTLTVATRQRLLPSDVIARMNYLQGYVVTSQGATVLASPMHVLTLNWDSLPDCNGNGINDYAEVIAHVTPDADNNLIPDDCP
jgi:hypothetical protein